MSLWLRLALSGAQAQAALRPRPEPEPEPADTHFDTRFGTCGRSDCGRTGTVGLPCTGCGSVIWR